VQYVDKRSKGMNRELNLLHCQTPTKLGTARPRDRRPAVACIPCIHFWPSCDRAQMSLHSVLRIHALSDGEAWSGIWLCSSLKPISRLVQVCPHIIASAGQVLGRIESQNPRFASTDKLGRTCLPHINLVSASVWSCFVVARAQHPCPTRFSVILVLFAGHTDVHTH